MEKIKTELDLLIKSFPFIKFTITQPGNDIRFYINYQDTNPNKYCYSCWYNPHDKNWVIHSYKRFLSFKNFLNEFILGLIKNKLY